MKVTLIPERCIACGLCQTYNDLFDYHDDGIVKFSGTETLEIETEESTSLLEAIHSCPTHAILKN